MPKLALNNIASGYATNSALNANFDTIETAMENTLSRDGSTPNHMLSSLDMNSHSIHNLGRATTLSSAMSLGQFLEYANTEESLTGVVPLTWEFTATGENSYSLPLLSTNKVDMYIISVDGLVLSPTTYTVNVDSQTIVFTDAPAEGSSLVIRLFGKIPEATASSITINNIRQSYIFDIATNETIFDTGVPLESNSVDVYLNGVKLVDTLDYTVTSTVITLLAIGAPGDIVEVVNSSSIVALSDSLAEVVATKAEVSALAVEAAQSASDAEAFAVAAAGGGILWTTKTADYTAASFDGVFCDTSAGSFTLTLPPSPSVGDKVIVVDSVSSFAINALTIGRNTLKIMGLSEDMTVNTMNASFELIYAGASSGWRIL